MNKTLFSLLILLILIIFTVVIGIVQTIELIAFSTLISCFIIIFYLLKQ